MNVNAEHEITRNNALGRRTVKEDQQGDTTSYNFDMSGRMLTRVYVGHPTSPLAGQTDTDTFTYDRNGRMLSGIKGRYNNTVTFSYDDRGQQVQETLTTHGQTYTVGYQKNELGQTIQLQYPDGSLVDRAYTPRGQLLSVDYAPAGAAASSDVADFVYDAGGRETTRNLGNGLTTSRTYFADNQIQIIATPTVETLTYTYDPNKNPTSETRSGVMAPYSWSTGPTGFDDEDRLTNWQRTNGDTQTWNLSPVHDWTSTTINGALQTRTHGPAHEILTMAGAEVDPSPAVLQHDTKGNMTTDDRGCGMAWDFDNMIQSFGANGVPDLKDATYEYDAIGRRVAKNVAETGGTQTTVYVQDGNQTIGDYAAGMAPNSPTYIYVYGSYVDEPVLRGGSGGLRYYHRNQQYSIIALTNGEGPIVERYVYDAYGSVTVLDTSLASLIATVEGNRYTYTGREFDNELSLYHYRARMYDPDTGRFRSRDPIGNLDGENLYCFVHSAPLHSLDPSGLFRLADLPDITLAGGFLGFGVIAVPMPGTPGGLMFRFQASITTGNCCCEKMGDCCLQFGTYVKKESTIEGGVYAGIMKSRFHAVTPFVKDLGKCPGNGYKMTGGITVRAVLGPLVGTCRATPEWSCSGNWRWTGMSLRANIQLTGHVTLSHTTDSCGD